MHGTGAQSFRFAIAAMIVGMSTSPAYAYLDPGTGSIILQAVLGSIVAGLVVIRFWWSKIKAACAHILGRTPEAGVQGDEGATRLDSERRR